MTELTLSQAAKATGKSKSTINRAIKSGKVSAIRKDDGSYSIDASELSRAFHIRTSEPTQRRITEPYGTDEAEPLKQRIEALEEMLEREREFSADLKEDRDRWRQQATSLLEDKRPKKGSIWKIWRSHD